MKICRVVPILDTVGHMTNYTWIGPVCGHSQFDSFFKFTLGTVGHVTICVKDRQDIIFKAILGKVDHMTNCTWIGPAVIILKLFIHYIYKICKNRF